MLSEHPTYSQLEVKRPDPQADNSPPSTALFLSLAGTLDH
jgi:hypothetical protein